MRTDYWAPESPRTFIIARHGSRFGKAGTAVFLHPHICVKEVSSGELLNREWVTEIERKGIIARADEIARQEALAEQRYQAEYKKTQRLLAKCGIKF